MNRINIWAAFAAVTLAGCANEEITEQSNLPVSDGGRKPIEVSTYTPRATRLLNTQEATIASLTEEGDGFSLTAKLNGNAFIDGVRYYANAQSGACHAEEGQIFYWPEEGTVSFSAYSPISDQITLYDYGILNITAKCQKDVLVAYTEVDASKNEGTVSLTFHHVLAQVQVNVACNADDLPAGATFTLDSISMYAPISVGIELNSGTIGAVAGENYMDYITFYDSKIGTDEVITVTDEPKLICTGMVPASGSFTGSKTVNPEQALINELTIAYTVTIGTSVKQYVKKANVTLYAGYLNKFNVTLSSDKPISITADVDEWDEADPQTPELVDAAPVDNSGVDNEGRPYIDLGLPSRTLWATYNIGALLPEEGGNFFAWGETESKDDFAENEYHFYQDGVVDKYSMSEGKNILDPEDDAATQNWGDDWCMPSVEQALELNDETYVTQEWTQIGNMYGLKITSKTFPENYIFLPAAGFHWPESDIQGVGTSGYYWTNEKYPNSNSSGTCYIVTDGENISIDDHQQRISGFLIRAVRKQN